MDPLVAAKQSLRDSETSRVKCNTDNGKSPEDTSTYPCTLPGGQTVSTAVIDRDIAQKKSAVDALYTKLLLTRTPAELATTMGNVTRVQAKYAEVETLRKNTTYVDKTDSSDHLAEKERDLTIVRDVTMVMAAVSSLLLVYTFVRLRG